MSFKRDIISYLIIIILAILLSQHLNVVVSGSMEPVFSKGDIVLTEKVNVLGINEFDPENLEVGDIVIYKAKWYNHNLVIHRIVGGYKDKNGNKYYITKGDNNPVTDPENVYPKEVVGKVITINNNPVYIPKIGYITMIFRGIN